MDKENFYCVTDFKKINRDTIDTHLKECDSLEEACRHKDCSFVIVRRSHGSEDIPGTGLFYAFVFSYKILDKNGQPFFITYKRVTCTDYIIKTKRMAYYDSTADAEVAFSDRNGEPGIQNLSGVYDGASSFFKGLISFMIDLEENCSADWNLYKIRKELSATIESQEKEIEKRNEHIALLKKKIQELRHKLRGKKP